ncbi:uncharacterized protein LOC134183374 isoform X2 [Corticium candelabrum]|uniref:uncharacterized protein LOC134183374 isoform X2 n=1 Tax=Corticium candelabrum TaxID=121492 RepID=UPI002E270B48|nr:uncharacterized protein LOC134183374 isoform X2 [Corticium candelabrum]
MSIVLTVTLLLKVTSFCDSQANQLKWPKDILTTVDALPDEASAWNYTIDPEWKTKWTTNVSSFLEYCNGSCQLDVEILEKFVKSLFKVKNAMAKYFLSEHFSDIIDSQELELLSHSYSLLFEQLIIQGVTSGEWKVGERQPQVLSLAVNLHAVHAVDCLLRHIYHHPDEYFFEYVHAMHQSVMNQDLQLLNMLTSQVVKASCVERLVEYLGTILNGRSVLDIAVLQCQRTTPSQCVVLSTLVGIVKKFDTNRGETEYTKLVETLDSDLSCSSYQIDMPGSQSLLSCLHSIELKNESQTEGTMNTNWMEILMATMHAATRKGSGGWRISQQSGIDSHGCDLPVISLIDLEPSHFIDDYVNLSQPILIKNATEQWHLRDRLEKSQLSADNGDVDVLVGLIPYGEVFGELNGYATISEFLIYMDELDIFSLWNDVLQVHQFILGPRGSGAPFHYHCPAVNVVCYGRKYWFLYPPGQAIYSKVHPFEWLQNYKQKAQYSLLHCVQHPGDLLFVPAGWTHSVLNLDEVVGMAVEFDTGNC